MMDDHNLSVVMTQYILMFVIRSPEFPVVIFLILTFGKYSSSKGKKFLVMTEDKGKFGLPIFFFILINAD